MMDSTATGWYYALQGERVGPRSLDDVRALVANGVLDADALVWTPGMREWSRVGDVSILAPDWVPPHSAPAPRAEAEWAPPADTAEPRPQPAGETYAWRRFLARIIDLFLYGIVLLTPVQIAAPEFMTPEYLARAQAAPAEIPMSLRLGFLLALGVTVILLDTLLVHLWSTTPGKALFGLRIVRSDGNRLSVRESLSRAIRAWAIGMGAGIAFATIVGGVMSYIRLTSRGRTHWDEALDLRVEHTPQTIGLVLRNVGLILLFLFSLSAVASMFLPTPP
ncbi:MAG TPA: RDD family protein [Longimicrobium sp.]